MKKERKIVGISLIISFLIIFVKVYCGKIFESYTFLALGYYTLCNFSNDLICMIASFIRKRKGSKREPFGYGKIPNSAMMFYGVVIFLLGIYIFIKVFFLNSYVIDFKVILPFIIVIISLLLFSNILFCFAKDIQSEVIMDITHDIYYDGIVTLAGFFFVVLAMFVPVFDVIGVLFISILIILMGLKLIINNIFWLKGQNDLNKRIVKNIEDSLRKCEGVNYSNCNLINVNKYYKVVIEILISDEVSLKDLIIWEEYVRGKIKSLVWNIKIVDFLIYKNN